MITPAFDLYGYPTVETLNAIQTWPYPFAGLLEFIKAAWHESGIIKDDGLFIEFHSGGWSGNEEIMNAINTNMVFMGLYWESSHRGGKDVFKKIL